MPNSTDQAKKDPFYSDDFKTKMKTSVQAAFVWGCSAAAFMAPIILVVSIGKRIAAGGGSSD